MIAVMAFICRKTLWLMTFCNYFCLLQNNHAQAAAWVRSAGSRRSIALENGQIGQHGHAFEERKVIFSRFPVVLKWILFD